MTISQEAIEAAHAEINKSWRNDRWEWDAPKHAAERALCAALPFLSTLPIAVEGKVKPLEWKQGDQDPSYHFAQSSIGNYVINEFPCVGDDQLTVRLLGTSQYGVWFKTIEEAKADAQGHLNIRILSALISSPGKDGDRQIYEFDRYINGRLMAEGVKVERASTQEDAFATAARIASRGPNREVPILVMRSTPCHPGKDGGQEVEAVGEAGEMPGSNGGFTMAAFKASKVPLGTIHKVAAPDKVLLKLVDVIEAAYQRGREDFRAELLGLIGAQRSEDQP